MDCGSGRLFQNVSGLKEYEKRILDMHVFCGYIGLQKAYIGLQKAYIGQ